MRKNEQIKMLEHLKESVRMQLKTVEESEQEILGKISNLEMQLEHVKGNNVVAMTVGDTTVEEFLEQQIKFEMQRFDSFIESNKEYVKYYENHVENIERALNQLLNV
ncbi:hypothetical protein AMS59_20865 [Lysinibacillus sp. FJAT-14745]|uniref:hypothetical protein n=1 Tax=Lysinibacillus sp. FJAT-14745 TaxID=1704289 RepID=UPI0006ABD8CA|nr:hypothetical protein [Lysinibacillus sp. FJAT-14745]KOP70275.1 hypothetical protein AMS59_20865 [Lysinibacillus sp. FJAT-14745]